MNKIFSALESGPNSLFIISAADLRDFFNELKSEAGEVKKPVGEDGKDYYTAHDVCDLLNVSMPTLWRWAKAGFLVPIMMGAGRRKKRLFRKCDIDRVLNDR